MAAILIFNCTEGAGVGDYRASSQTVPRPESSFDTYARWKPVKQSPRSRTSYGKIEDCEQSNAQSLLFIRSWLCFNEEVIWSSTISNGNFRHHLRDSRIYYSRTVTGKARTPGVLESFRNTEATATKMSKCH